MQSAESRAITGFSCKQIYKLICLHYVLQYVYENLPIMVVLKPNTMSAPAIQIYSEGIQGYDELKRLKDQLTPDKVNTATRISINDTLRWSKTQIRKTIQESYNIKAKRVNDDDPKKGLVPRFASTTKLWGVITAGHRPINMSSLTRTRQTDTGVSVEVMKGERQVIQRAFLLPNGAVVARGEYADKGGFVFRHGTGERTDNTQGHDAFSPLNTVSIATAALNTRAFTKWSAPTQEHYDGRILHQLKRMLNM